jgi:HAD superfamily hydrolase (TIGR01490 family)
MPRIAFFDMDKTLLRKSSSTLYVRYLLRRRMISMREAAGVMWVTAQYSLNTLDFPKAVARLSKSVRGGDAQATKALCDRWAEDELFSYIAPAALERLRAHQATGDAVWLLSASTQFAVLPVADHLGIRSRYTELEVVDGRFTGSIVDEPCYGPGKVTWAQRIADEAGTTLADSAFYTDSFSDRPLLDLVGEPVAVNPDRKLRGYAAARGWPIVNFY